MDNETDGKWPSVRDDGEAKNRQKEIVRGRVDNIMNKSGRKIEEGLGNREIYKRLNERRGKKREVDPVWYRAATFVRVLYGPRFVIIMRKLMNPIGLGEGSLSV